MAYDIRINGEHAKLVLSGDVDLQTTADLKTDIEKINGITHFEIDASGVTYIDSSGIATLLLARQHCAQNNITLLLPVISVAVHRVLQVARLDQLLPPAEIVDAADSGVMGLGAATDMADDALISELMVASDNSGTADLVQDADLTPGAGGEAETTTPWDVGTPVDADFAPADADFAPADVDFANAMPSEAHSDPIADPDAIFADGGNGFGNEVTGEPEAVHEDESSSVPPEITPGQFG